MLKNSLDLTAGEVNFLLSPPAIRERAAKIFDLCQMGQTSFAYHPEKLKSTVDYVLKTIHKNYPDMNIPFHSRWGHFKVGGIDRVLSLTQRLPIDAMERARAKLDLVITSVLLDAGSGPSWTYFEKESGKTFSRSEGLGVASFHMFLSGMMSSDRKSLRADRAGLAKVTAADLKNSFGVSDRNPLVGIEGRVALLNNLATAVANKEIFPAERPGGILDSLAKKYGSTIPATGILRAVLDGLGVIWPGRLSAGQVNLGDVWHYSKLSGKSSEQLVPFHKLSQWMTYSLIEPIAEAGFNVEGVEQLTGLAEYRNGGLMIDSGLISFRNPKDQEAKWRPDTDLIIEWRALTVHLLDMIGAEVQKAIGRTPAEFPLAKVLEGGTWWAGRFLAAEKRAGGTPPLQIESDGTVF